MLHAITFIMAGLVGSVHCAAMCGPIVVVIGAAAPAPRMNLSRQCTYSAGRLFTYVFLGVTAAYVGDRISNAFPYAVQIQASLAVLAGGFLLIQTLSAAGLLPRRSSIAKPGIRALFSNLFRSAFQATDKRSSFFAGMATGLLPCGLLYSIVVLAATTQSAVLAAAMMAAFWLGTIPTMLTVGCGSSCFRRNANHRLHFLAVCALAVVSITTMARGVMAFSGMGGGTQSCAHVETIPN